jgi:uncharacterized protein YbbC (DUF1343 family)
LRGARLGLLMNQASVDRQFRYACDVLAEAYPGQLRVLFSPQHGLWGERQANMIESPHVVHPRLQIPVYSLYSETRSPSAGMLADLDVLVVDLQDVGTRVYTLIWTISYCLEACAATGKTVVLLDRPNPLGGELVEGPLLDPDFGSFVGRASIPMRHGLTLGELTVFVNRELGINAELHVVPMQGWRRGMDFAETGRTWIAPSPNVPRVESVLVYPGQVLLEGTNLSEGRGTTVPFEVCGAPFIDAERLAEALEQFDLPGVLFRPVRFLPTFDKWAGQTCEGVALHVTDAGRFRPYRTSAAILAATRRLWPTDFAWLDPPYEYETEKPPIDIIAGGARLREAIDAGQCRDPGSLDRLTALDEQAWRQRTQDVRLY